MKLRQMKMALMLFMSMMWMTGFAQTAPVEGFVKDASGEPLIGVTVSVAGSKTGTVTDVNGRFTMAASTWAISRKSSG